jgi:D-3-phosphoglycerate dehydrogenase
MATKNHADRTLVVRRMNISPYQANNFAKQEQAMVESLGLRYDPEHSCPDIIITNTHSKPSEWPSSFLQNTKLLIHPNSGYDNFSPLFLKEASFKIVLGNSIRAHAVVEYILSELFSHFSSVPDQKQWDKERAWPRTLLHQQRVLLIGHGHIGQILAPALTPLVGELAIHDPIKGHELSSFSGFDVVILAASLTETSRLFVNASFLNTLNNPFLLINTARGELIDEEALCKTLIERPGARAVLDVFTTEPRPSGHPFEKLPNIKLSSHIAGVHAALDQGILAFEERVLRDFLLE